MATEANDVDYAIAIPTFVGSLLSFLGSATALCLHIARPPRRHFRHALIVNLLVADLIYGLGNTISGGIFLGSGHTPSPLAEPDTACLVSGFFSQSNAQAVDFNILIIAIVVLMSILKKNSIANLATKWQILICIAAWVPGIVTGTVGLVLGSYGYVSGNWCWITSKHLGLRYALSHGWRIAIFFAAIFIYTYIYISLKRVFKNLRSLPTPNTGTRTVQDNQPSVLAGNAEYNDDDDRNILVAHSVDISSHEMNSVSTSKPDISDTSDGHNTISNGFFDGEANSQSRVVAAEGGSRATVDGTVFETSRMPAAPNVRKMLLMNGYPLAYIVLWIPGIANRLAESVGQAPRWLTGLQACTQYIGLINALTYGMSEQMRQGVWKTLKDGRGGGGRG